MKKRNRPTSEPQVPGALGNNPVPNQVEAKAAGCQKDKLAGRVGRVSVDDGGMALTIAPFQRPELLLPGRQYRHHDR